MNTSLVLDLSFQSIPGVQLQRPKQRMKNFVSSTDRYSLHLLLLTWFTLSKLAWWKLFFPQSLLCRAVFWDFLNFCSLRSHHLDWEAQRCPVVGPLELAGTICVWHGPALASPHWGHPCSPSLPAPGHLHPVQLFSVFQSVKQTLSTLRYLGYTQIYNKLDEFFFKFLIKILLGPKYSR